MKLFDLDGPFQHYGGMVFDLLILNLCWLFISLFSFGVLSGPATIALYHSVYQAVVTKNGYALKSFLVSLKQRFFYQWFFSLLYFGLLLLTGFNLYLTLTGRFGVIWLMPVYIFIFLELALTGTIALPLLSQNRHLRFGSLWKISFIVANKHLPWVFLASIPNFLLAVLILLNFLGYVQLAVFLFFFPALNALAMGQLILNKILKPYQFFENFDQGFQ